MAFVPTTGVATPSTQSFTPSFTCARHSSFTGVSVLPAPRVSAPYPSARTSPRMASGKTVLGTIVDMPQFSTFVKLASLVKLRSLESATIFVPTDASFARLPAGFLEDLMTRPVDLGNLLRRHVLPNRTVTIKQIKGCGFWDGVWGGPLSYEGLGPVVRVGNARVLLESSDIECDNGVVHTIDTLLTSPMVKAAGVAQTFVPAVKSFGESTVATFYPRKMTQFEQARAAKAGLPGTTGGRRAMGLIKQLPFWQYGPPYNAAKQEEYEPISIAQPDVAKIDYQVFPAGSVVVTPDEVSSSKLMPVSGMSKYIGNTKRIVEGDALSDYSRLDDLGDGKGSGASS